MMQGLPGGGCCGGQGADEPWAYPQMTMTVTQPNCAFCGKPVNPLTGNPGEWDLVFSHPDGTGVTHSHHVKCVMERLFDENGRVVEVSRKTTFDY